MNVEHLKRRVTIKRDQHLHGPEWLLADEISKAFGEQRKFAMYLATIRRVGIKRARANFDHVKETKARNPRSLFFYLSRKDVIKAERKK